MIQLYTALILKAIFPCSPSQPRPVPIAWGVCVPAACTEQDVAFGFKEIIQGLRRMYTYLYYATTVSVLICSIFGLRVHSGSLFHEGLLIQTEMIIANHDDFHHVQVELLLY